MIDHIPELCEAGIDSFKIEGRMKTALYVATVARAYRNAIDTYYENPDEYKKNIPLYFEEIGKCTNRMFTTGFYFGKPSGESMVYGESTYVKDYVYLGTVLGVSGVNAGECGDVGKAYKCELIQKNKFFTGDTIEILSPGSLDIKKCNVLKITDEQGNDMPSCPHASQKIFVYIDKEIEPGDLFRRGPDI